MLDTLTAYENISLALSIQNKGEKEIDKKVNDVATKLGIKEVLQKYPYQNVGRTKAKSGVSKSNSYRPTNRLADEPTGGFR